MSLFQTLAWQRAWWSTWGNTPGLQLLNEGGANQSGLYLDCYRFRSIIPIRCLQFVGTSYRRLSTPRSEYNTLLGPQVTPQEAERAYEKALDLGAWSEAVFRDITDGDAESLKAVATQKGWLIREVASDTAYAIDTSGSFEHYLSKLGSNTRLKLYNRRKILASLGKIDVFNAWPNGVDRFFEQLNDFHRARWGQPCFNAQSLLFHKAFLKAVISEGGIPELSTLECDGKAVSVLYNVWYKGCVYNLQSGFLEAFHKKIALGTLHLGFSIEGAFERSDTDCFDMLAGTGKNENYKLRLATRSVSLRSYMVVKSLWLKALYALKASFTSNGR